MDLGIIWIFIAAIAVAFAMAFVSDIRRKRSAENYRTEYEQSLKVQEEILVLLRESVSLQAKANQQLLAIHQSLDNANEKGKD